MFGICPDAVKASRQQPDGQSAFCVQVAWHVMSLAHAEPAQHSSLLVQLAPAPEHVVEQYPTAAHTCVTTFGVNAADVISGAQHPEAHCDESEQVRVQKACKPRVTSPAQTLKQHSPGPEHGAPRSRHEAAVASSTLASGTPASTTASAPALASKAGAEPGPPASALGEWAASPPQAMAAGTRMIAAM
jgi:hypothetical protein